MLKLIRPHNDFLESYAEAIKEDKEIRPNAACIFENAEEVIQNSYNNEHGIHLKPGFVKATTFWLVEENRFIGEISIRHELTPCLLQFGGNIGYEIRCSECRKGYGSKMLSMVLPYCKDSLGLKRVLITCDDDNIGSRKVIENNGGILENKVVNVLDRGTVLTRRYWIDLTEASL